MCPSILGSAIICSTVSSSSSSLLNRSQKYSCQLLRISYLFVNIFCFKLFCRLFYFDKNFRYCFLLLFSSLCCIFWLIFFLYVLVATFLHFQNYCFCSFLYHYVFVTSCVFIIVLSHFLICLHSIYLLLILGFSI